MRGLSDAGISGVGFKLKFRLSRELCFGDDAIWGYSWIPRVFRFRLLLCFMVLARQDSRVAGSWANIKAFSLLSLGYLRPVALNQYNPKP